MLQLVPTFTIAVDLAPTLEVGQLPAGYRRVIPIVGGVVHGAGLTGTVVPGGADWGTVRSDGVAELWARYELRFDDGTLVSVVNTARVRSAPVAETAETAGQTILTVPSFEAPDGPLAWLNEATFVGELHRSGPAQVTVVVHQVQAAPSLPPA